MGSADFAAEHQSTDQLPDGSPDTRPAGHRRRLPEARVDPAGRGTAEAAPREAEALLHLVTTNAPLILFACDRAGVITRAEGRGLAALGHRPGALVGQSVWPRALPVRGLVDDLGRALAGGSFTKTTEVRGMVFECRHTPQRDETGAVVGLIAVATDVTERVRAEREAQRLKVGLSPREEEVLELLPREDLRGYAEIGTALHLEGETVRGHVKAIAAKLGLRTSKRAAARAPCARARRTARPGTPPR